MHSQLTRRDLAASIVGASTALAQAPANPEDPLKAARDQIVQSADQLSKVAVGMTTEPAFVFKA